MKNNLIAISVFSLAISIVVGSWLISNGLSADTLKQANQIELKEKNVEDDKKKLFTQEELAWYLGLSIEESRRLGPIGEGGTQTSILPFIKIGEKVYYSKEAIDQWLIEDGVASVQIN